MDTVCVAIPPTVSIALLVCCGYYGNGEERKQKLKEDGYDYNTIQNCVNDIMPILRRYG